MRGSGVIFLERFSHFKFPSLDVIIKVSPTEYYKKN